MRKLTLSPTLSEKKTTTNNMAQSEQKQKEPANKQQANIKVSAVQIEGLVLLKIIKHCNEYLAQRQPVSGKLLGLRGSQGNTVEITNCFPIPIQFTESSTFDDDNKKRKLNERANNYAQDMIRLMSRIREDNLTVGFYRSALNGSFVLRSTIEAQYQHQLQSTSSVCIIYDPTASIRGRLVLRAFRLTDEFMKFYHAQNFGLSSVSKYDVSSNDIFEELDIKIHNSHLVHAFLYEIAQLPPDRSLTYVISSSSLHSL